MMTREYLRYALMAAALGFGVLIMIVGGMLILPCLFISPFRFLPDNFFITLLAICCGFIGGPYCLLLAVTKLGSWLAAKTPLSCSVSAGLLPLLIATPALAFLPAGLGVLPSRLPFTFKDLDMLDFLLLSACLLAGLLYALFLLAFSLSHRARKGTEMHGEGERSAAASDTGTMARAYRRYLVAAGVDSCSLPIDGVFCGLNNVCFAVTAMDRYGRESAPAELSAGFFGAAEDPRGFLSHDSGTLSIPAQDCPYLAIVDLYGRIVRTAPYSRQVSIARLPKGIYQIRTLGRKGRSVGIGYFIK